MSNYFEIVQAYLFRFASRVRENPLEVGTPVRVYRNLHNGKLSVQVRQDGKWKVHTHVDDIALDDPQFKVSQKGRERVLREKSKNVHAFVLGNVADHSSFDPESARQVTYNPYKMEHFSTKHDGQPIFSANHARVQSSGHIHVN